jgi:flavin-dependent dehydrogenase
MSDATAPSGRPEHDADVVVIGGGPGGSTTATMLARKGYRVLLLERERFPREHIGESLLPASMPILEELGVLPAVQAEGFLPKWGATMVWGRGPVPWSWYFRETNRRYPHAFQVWRPRFDQILLENARAHGVDVREGHTVLGVLFEDGRAVGVRYTGDSSEAAAAARIVVDASGQGALLGRRLGLRRWDPSFQNLAVYGYFAGARRLPPPDETNILVESYPNGWFWGIPLHTGVMSVGAVVDRRTGQEGIRADGAAGFLAAQIAQAPHIASMVRDAEFVSGPVVLKDWSYVSTEVTGDGWILVGDAACFIDPLFSSGVHLALSAGVLAAAWVTTALKRPEMAAAAGQVYKDLYYRQYDHFRAMAQLFYASNQTVESYFWEARRLLGLDAGMTPRQAFIHAVAGQSPLGYERAVLERGSAPASFVRDVRAVQSAREQRRAWLHAADQDAATNGRHPLATAVPRLASGVRIERRPVLDEGEFVWGHALVTAGYPEGTPCSPFVAALLSRVDGQTSTEQLIARIAAGQDAPRTAQIAQSVLSALGILFVDGTVELRT